MKVHIARDGQVLGEWTQTELYPLLRASEILPSDYYWHEGMTEWKRLAELPSGKSVLATPAQRQMLDNHGLPWDEFTTKYEVSNLMDSRPYTDKQRSFMAGDTPDAPATRTQILIIPQLAADRALSLTISPPFSRREVAREIHALRCFPAMPN
ncbi:MAG: hypothetical protein DME36_14190 [Verrucomicrobia bacterium]|nr:MAG: hypothetical protein DME36_14190 [Verrucomicrobiota bacterium]